MNFAKMGKGKLGIWGLTAAILLAGAYFIFAPSGGGDTSMRGMGRDVPVTAMVVKPVAFTDVIEAIGTTLAKESVMITARVADTVQRMNFQDGDWVEKGRILVELTSSEELAQVHEAEANVKEAQQQYDRVADLFKTGNASKSTLDARARSLSEATSRLDVAAARAGDRVISAPFAGVLGFRMVTTGALVSPGTVVTTLDDVSMVKLDFSIPEKFMASLAEGQEVEAVAAAYPDRVFTGVVRTIGSRVDPVTRSVMVRAFIENADKALRPGMLMSLSLLSNRRDALAVSEESIVPISNTKFVYRVGADNSVEMVKVKTASRQDGLVEIVDGLKAGDVVVVSGTLRLRPGIKVIIDGAKEGPKP